MRKFQRLIFTGILSFSILFLAATSVQAKPAMMLMGDSWAWLVCIDNSFVAAFREANVDADIAACIPTTGPGLRAENWRSKKQHQNSLSMLKKRRDVEVVYLSLGGNDFLSHWNKNMNTQEEAELHATIRTNIQNIIQDIHAVRPDVKVLLSNYDYSRFVSENTKIKNYQKIYERVGSPTAGEMHRGIMRFAESLASLADQKTTFYIQHFGLMHYYFGNRESGLAPGVSTPPELISPPSSPNAWGGVPEYELDQKAMIKLGKLVDSYHLRPEAYFYLARHSVQHYLKYWLPQTPIK